MSETWTVLKLLGWAAEFFKKQAIENPRRLAEDLLGHALDLDRLHLYLQFEYVLTPSELALFKSLIQRRLGGEPLQYLLGWQPFAGLRIKIDRRALIPRPETEELAARLAKRLPRGGEIRAADIATGSGCLALSLAAGLGARVWATDISQDALSLARENAAALKLDDKVVFLPGNLLEPLAAHDVGSLDLIVSNPPYIAEGQRDGLPREVREFEPAQALFGGADGLEFLAPLLDQAPSFLKPGGLLALECGLEQPQVLASRAGAAWARVWVEKDQSGRERYLFGERQ